MFGYEDELQSEIEYLKKQISKLHSDEDMKKAFKVGFSIGYGSDTYAIEERNKTCEEWFEWYKK